MDWDLFMSTLYGVQETIKAGEADELEVHRAWYSDEGEVQEELNIVLRRNPASREQIAELTEFLRPYQEED